MFGSLATAVLLFVVLLIWVIVAVSFRKVVPPNEVHIVRTGRKSVSYGVTPSVAGEDKAGGSVEDLTEDLTAGNAYYAWPSWIPRAGRQVVELPLHVFTLFLDSYDAYDVGKVPFVVDIAAFFRIAYPSVAAQRISDLEELDAQLKSILQGAVRTVLAQHDIEQIMLDRSTFGDLFTALTKEQLAAWGVVNVKNIELMDIRDPKDAKSNTVANIMAKKESFIAMQSAQEVAENNKNARVAQIAAQQVEEVREQERLELVGRRTAEKDQVVGIATERANQEIQKEAATTTRLQMEVLSVDTVRKAEIEKEAQVIAAAQQRDVTVLHAEGQREQLTIHADGKLAEQKREAEGTLAVGQAVAEAKRLSEMALVDPQIVLAKEIGENDSYQRYLVSIRNVEMIEEVGVEQAKALQGAEIQVIANAGGNIGAGVDSVGELFSVKGGLALGSALEGLAGTPVGARVVEAVTGPAKKIVGNGSAKADPAE